MQEINFLAESSQKAKPAQDNQITGPLSTTKRRVVIVLGMHRSGTSLLASLLTELGLDLGNRLIPSDSNNEEGYWEQADINRTQDTILDRLRKSWQGPAWMNPSPLDWGQLALSERQQFKHELASIVLDELSKTKGLWGFKDPRTMRLLPLWEEIFNEHGIEPNYILAIRNPADVAASIAKRDKLSTPHAEMLWLLHNLDAIRGNGAHLRLVISYDRWFTHTEEQVCAVTQALNLTPNVPTEQLILAVRKRIRPDLRHWQTERDFSLPYVAEAYQLLKQASESGRVGEDLPRLSVAVNRAFETGESWTVLPVQEEMPQLHPPAPRVETVSPADSKATDKGEAQQPLTRLIAFYLPQYHPIPENDAWWGPGFTEWTNVGRAKPLFQGHKQPRVPADLGYYDLRLPEARAAQAALARAYGIHGFCYYHYWFDGRRLLERPFNEVLASGSPELPFCLCWANENWTRAWDGLEREVLMAQRYSKADDLNHIRWLAQAFRDPRYIRVHGKPIFLVYRTASLPDAAQTASVWREEARRLGVGELFLVSVESRVGAHQPTTPAQIGFDAAVEFQPDGLFFPKPLQRLNHYGGIFDYGAVVDCMLKKPAADYLRFPCVAPGWDNSPRRKENPTILTGCTPELYEKWLNAVVQRQSKARPPENLVFVNAWNEWGEGAHLEPDDLSGRAYLEATKRAVLQQPTPAKPCHEPSSAVSDPIEVSIVIPTFNRLDLTRRCLESLAKETGKTKVEVIVVDNASTDGTVDFLRAEAEAGHLRALLNQENLGFAKACNQGAQAAAGRHILFLNNDTQVQPGWLEPLVETMEADQKVVGVGAKLLFPDRTIQHAGVVILEDRKLPDPLVARHIHYRRPDGIPEASQASTYQALTAACLLVRKTAFKKAGGFDEEYWNGYEDVDLCFKLQRDGGLLVYQPRSIVIHFESQSGPERFRQVAHNTQRLHQKWIGKITPDYVVAEDGTVSRTSAHKIAPYGGKTAPLVSIIILAHNQLADTRLCLDSIRAHTPLPHELILVDNGSTDGTSDYFQSLAKQQTNVVVISNRRNLGFAAGNNQGLAIARGEDIVLLNNDTVVTAGWLDNMRRTLAAHPECGLAGPVSNYVSGPQLAAAVSYSSLEQLPQSAGSWCAAHAGQSGETSRLVGFCLLLRRAVLQKIGGLDPQFGSGNFEDDDFSIRASLAGFKLRIALDSFVHHTGGQTFKGAKIDYRASMERNWELFKAKWAMPKDAPLEKGYSYPAAVPPGLALRLPLPQLQHSHTSTLEGRYWTDKTSPKAEPKPASPKFVIIEPPCAQIGSLAGARDLFRKKQWPAAWGATIAALSVRPYHPEAYLLLGEIAQAGGAADAARQCAKAAREMAPDWVPPKKFLKGNLRGNAKPSWLKLPPALSGGAGSASPRISVCLIARNEERFLAQCLRSVQSLASQIIVVDTGSTDRTVEIAKEFGAEVHPFPWGDDFSAARNAALEHASGDWILILDADEELMPDKVEVVAKEIRAAHVLGYRLPIIDRGREETGCNYVQRLFRNAPGLYFVGRIHEQVFSTINLRCRQWGLKNILGQTALLHHGYTAAVMASRNKMERNLRLLKLAVEEMPGEPTLVMNLGLELVRSGQLEAGLERYWEAFHLLSDLPESAVTPEGREALLTQLSIHLIACKRYAELPRLWQSAFAQKGGMTASQHFCLGAAHLELKQFEPAAEQMRQCLAKRHLPALSPVLPEILKAAPQHGLAMCLWSLKETAEAAQAFAAARAADPASRAVRFDLARFHASQGCLAESMQLLRELAAEQPVDLPIWTVGGVISLSQPEQLPGALDWTAAALRHFPEDPDLLRQRAEALLLNQDVAGALLAWRRAAAGGSRHCRGAIILCELLLDDRQSHFAAGEEPALSQEAVQWYRQCIRMAAHRVVSQLHERMDAIRLVLPGFVRVCEAAHRQARLAAA